MDILILKRFVQDLDDSHTQPQTPCNSKTSMSYTNFVHTRIKTIHQNSIYAMKDLDTSIHIIIQFFTNNSVYFQEDFTGKSRKYEQKT